MKAILLAGGLGTRLRPITDTIPKCMVEIHGLPMLFWWKKLLDKHGIDEVMINISQDYGDFRLPYDWGFSWEGNLLGSLGTLINIREFWQNEEYFLVAYADVLTNCDLTKMIEYHKSHDYPITLGVKVSDRMREKGMVVCKSDGLVTAYEEKPIHVRSDIANAGIYIFDSSIRYHIPPNGRDIGYDLLPLYVNAMRAYVIEEYLQDIGNPADLKKANDEFPGI